MKSSKSTPGKLSLFTRGGGNRELLQLGDAIDLPTVAIEERVGSRVQLDGRVALLPLVNDVIRLVSVCKQ